jgi:thiol:disulfide interchange protein
MSRKLFSLAAVPVLAALAWLAPARAGAGELPGRHVHDPFATEAQAASFGRTPQPWGYQTSVFQPLSYGQALAKAQRERKLVVMYFTTTWCKYCKQFEAETLSSERVRNLLMNRAIAIQVDGDKFGNLVQGYKVQVYPTVVIVDGAGRVVGRVAGYVPLNQFLAEASRFIR